MLLFRPFLMQCARDSHPPEELAATVDMCVSSARKTIEIVYEAYKVHTYFQTWYVGTALAKTRVGPIWLTHER